MKLRARIFAALTILAFLMLASAAHAALLVEYTFDEAASGTTDALNTGSAASATLSFKNDATRTSSAPTTPHNPVTHAPLNVASLDLTTGTSPALNDAAQKATGITALNSLTQYTASFWINLQADPHEYDRVLNAGTQLQLVITKSDGGAAGTTTAVDADAFYLRVGRSSVSGKDAWRWTSPVSFDAEQKWLFLAVAVDFTAGTTTYYVGNEVAAVVSVGAGVAQGVVGPNAGTLATSTGTTPHFVLGDFDPGTWPDDRTPAMWLDSFRINSGLLTQSELNDLRLSDVQLLSIPEPTSITLTMLSLAGLFKRPRRRIGQHV